MTSIIAKREDYLKKIDEIKRKIEIEIQSYKSELESQLEDKMAIYSAEITSKYSAEIEKYEARIRVLEDIIKEEMAVPEKIISVIEEIKQEEKVEGPVEEPEIDSPIEPELTGETLIEGAASIVEVAEEPVAEQSITSRPGMMTIDSPSRV